MSTKTEKTQTLEDQIKAEIEALRVEDEVRAARVARIRALQTPVMERCVEILTTTPLADALPLLTSQAEVLTDNRQNAVHQLIAVGQYTLQVLTQELADARSPAV